MVNFRSFKLPIFYLSACFLMVVPFATLSQPLRESLKDLMDHWKTEKIIIKEVPVQRQVPEVIVQEEPEAVAREIEAINEEPAATATERIVYRDIEADPEAPPPPPLPLSYVPNKKIDVKSLFNEMQIRTEVAVRRGGLPSLERERDESYRAHFQVVVNVPEASRSMSELARVNSRLPDILPGLEMMLSQAKVSGFFHLLYKDKLEHTQQKLINLEQALSRHNFYDCQTILEMTHPDSGQKVVLVQADMDVVADGSDGDRLPRMDPAVISSPSYQPETSYRWPKRTPRPNPLLPVIKERLSSARARLANGAGPAEEASLAYQVKHLPNTITGLEKNSFLIAPEDPFIVLPLSMHSYVGHHPHTPRMGDYAVVIYKNRVYPAICGDYGPKTKIGEGSLRLAKELNSKATPRYRPVSDLAVTYIIFPNSRDLPPGPPDYARWHQKCLSLLQTIGGLGQSVTLHQWQDRLPDQTMLESGPMPGQPLLP